MKTQTSILLFCLLGLSSLMAQIPYTSQFFTTRINQNPAFTGIDNLSRLSFDGKSYFFPYRGGSLFTHLSYEQAIGKDSSPQGVGVVFQKDLINGSEYLDFEAKLSYAREFSISENQTLRVGISGAIKQRSAEYYSFRFPDQIDPRDTSRISVPGEEVTTLRRPDVDLGVVYTNKNLFLSLSFQNIISPEYPFVSQQKWIPVETSRRITLLAGGEIPLLDLGDIFGQKAQFSVKPYTLIALEKNAQQIALGVQNQAGPFMLGYLYKSYGQHILQSGLYLGPVSLGYSYDFAFSPRQGLTFSPTHELSIQLLIPSQKRSKKNLPLPNL